MTEPIAEPSGIRFSLPVTASIPGPRKVFAPLGMLEYVRDPVKVGAQLRPTSGDGLVTTAKGHSAMLVCYGETLARACFTDMDNWMRPGGGLVSPPASHPNVAAMLDAMVLLNGPEWQRRRRLAVPPTNKEALLDGMRESFTRTASELTEDVVLGSLVDVGQRALRVSLRNNVRCLMGLEPGEGEPLAKKLDFFINSLVDPGVGLTQRLPWLIPGTPYARWVNDAESLYGTLQSLVQKRRLRGGAEDMLGALLGPAEDGTPALTDAEAVGELTGLYAAGYETTAQTLTWTLLMLACHPEAARAAQEEASSLLKGDIPTFAQCKALGQLDAIVRETQRLIPAVPSSIPRVAVREVDMDGHKIPVGSALVCSIVSSHHDERYFPQPYKFQPERWETLRKQSAALTYRFMPFGSGPRRCVGGVLADYQLRATLAWLLQRYSFRLPPKTRVDYKMRQVVLGPAKPLRLLVGAAGEWARNNDLPMGGIRRLVQPS
jgi:cytochrome P450